MTSRITGRFFDSRARGAIAIGLALAGASGCTIKEKENPPASTTGGGNPTSGGSIGSTGDAGATNGAQDAASGGPDAAIDCSTVGEAGRCYGSTLAYCSSGKVEQVDCASIGGSCEESAGRADCTAGARSSGCGTLDTLGTCDGAKLEFCDQSGLAATARTIDCAAYGQTCDPHGATDNGAICVPYGACPADVTDDGVCNGNNLSFCEDGKLYKFDCGVDQCQTMAGFADCYASGTGLGCSTETAAGRCDGDVRVSCLGDTVAREDCAFLGLACKADGSGGASCQAGSCAAGCPTGFQCNSAGHCAPATAPTRNWTVMIYMVADNNLSSAGISNLNDMEKIGSTAGVQIVAESEFSENPFYGSSDITSKYGSGTMRFPVVKDSNTSDPTSLGGAQSLGNLNMSTPSTLTDFIKSAASQYPAQHYALVLWNHGGGFQGGFVDENDRGFMSLHDLVDGIRNSGVHLDVLEFDACLMAMHEVGLAFRGVADTLTASEESEPGAGDPYDRILGALTATPTMAGPDLAKVIVDQYQGSYQSSSRPTQVTKSAMDLTKIGSFNEQLASMGAAIDGELGTQRSQIRSAIADTSVTRFEIQDYADVSKLLSSLSGLSGQTAASASAAATSLGQSGVMLDAKGTGDLAGAGGMSIFLPAPGSEPSISLDDYRQAVTGLPLQPWAEFLSRVSSDEPPPSQPGTDAVDAFSVVLSWGDTPDGKTSDVDLDLYVYEPNGEPAVPAIGTVSANGVLSGDSADTGISQESYTLSANHLPGTYIVLAHYYQGPSGKSAYPTLQILRSDLPGGSRALVRAKIVDRQLSLVPMDGSHPLSDSDPDSGTSGTITDSNLQQVLDLDYSDIWYATEIEVK